MRSLKQSPSSSRQRSNRSDPSIDTDGGAAVGDGQSSEQSYLRNAGPLEALDTSEKYVCYRR